jgi:hypothetical protein
MKTKWKIILIPVVIVVAVSLYLSFGGSPPFVMDRNGVERIDLVLGARTPTNYPEPAVPYYSHSITDRQDLAGILDVLTTAKSTRNHRCSHDITLTVVYANGEQKRLDPLPGHEPEFYEFRTSFGFIYKIDCEQFFRALSDADVDTNLLTEEALMRGHEQGSTIGSP